MKNRDLVLLDAPSNLGLRPPAEGAVPGVYKLAGALRDQRLLERLGAREGGVVVPPRYHSQWEPGAGVRNEEAIARYSRRLAERLERLLDDGAFPVVLGGDCSILLGHMLALRRRGRHGLIFIDGHSDFRHPGNAEFVGAAAGEDLALVTGRGDSLANLDDLGPFVRDPDVVVVGVRNEGTLDELQAAGMGVYTAEEVLSVGAARAAGIATGALPINDLDGFWIHCDVDVLDSTVMPAVDTPEPNGLDFPDLAALLAGLLANERALGLELTIFDPDLDESGELARRLADCVCAAFERSEAFATVEPERGRREQRGGIHEST
jgi:arginase